MYCIKIHKHHLQSRWPPAISFRLSNRIFKINFFIKFNECMLYYLIQENWIDIILIQTVGTWVLVFQFVTCHYLWDSGQRMLDCEAPSPDQKRGHFHIIFLMEHYSWPRLNQANKLLEISLLPLVNYFLKSPLEKHLLLPEETKLWGLSAGDITSYKSPMNRHQGSGDCSFSKGTWLSLAWEFQGLASWQSDLSGQETFHY